jgi:hypothetical protein
MLFTRLFTKESAVPTSRDKLTIGVPVIGKPEAPPVEGKQFYFVHTDGVFSRTGTVMYTDGELIVTKRSVYRLQS